MKRLGEDNLCRATYIFMPRHETLTRVVLCLARFQGNARVEMVKNDFIQYLSRTVTVILAAVDADAAAILLPRRNASNERRPSGPQSPLYWYFCVTAMHDAADADKVFY